MSSHYYRTDLLEQRLAQKRAEWKNFPERRARIEAEVSVLKVGLSVINNRIEKNIQVPEDGLTVEDAQQALL